MDEIYHLKYLLEYREPKGPINQWMISNDILIIEISIRIDEPMVEIVSGGGERKFDEEQDPNI